MCFFKTSSLLILGDFMVGRHSQSKCLIVLLFPKIIISNYFKASPERNLYELMKIEVDASESLEKFCWHNENNRNFGCYTTLNSAMISSIRQTAEFPSIQKICYVSVHTQLCWKPWKQVCCGAKNMKHGTRFVCGLKC